MKLWSLALCIVLVSFVSLFPVSVAVPKDQIFGASFTVEVEWNKTYGGDKNDVCLAMIQTLDGGYALTGYTESYGAGYRDFWLIKTDSSGNLKWSKTFGGGSGHEDASALLQTGDGGFVLFGGRQEFLGGRTSFWLVRTDSSGNMQWNKTFYPRALMDGTITEGSAWGTSFVRTTDGGYLLAGRATTRYTWDEQNKRFIENDDFWLVKTDQYGNEQWNKTYDSGGVRDWPYSVLEASWVNEGGYAVLGLAASGLGETWGEDFWLVKTDLQGNMQWNRKFDKSSIDRGYGILETPQTGGYLLAGPTYTGFWLIKIDKNGQIQWEKTIASTRTVSSTHIKQTTDQGYISAWEDVLIRLDDSGNVIWRENLFNYGIGYSPSVVVETAESEYVIAGSKEVSYGNIDFSLLKLAVSETPETPAFSPWLLIAVGLVIVVVVIVISIIYLTKRKKHGAPRG